MAKCEQITTLRRDRLTPRPIGGNLAPVRMVEVEKAILRAIGVPVG
jgi:mRNA-degrading endonuclease toxin of MazEF toxin-antitoxin module